MESYNAQSCSALEKPFYRPIEAALRWCNLTAHELDGLQITGVSLLPPAHAFPHWPCLRANAEKIIDAIQNGELQKGREGRTVAPGETVAKEKMTVRHTDLKAWMAKHYPDQKPKFLFDEIERSTHAMYNAETFQALQAERDAAKATIEVARQLAERIVEELNTVRAERDALAVQAKEIDPLDPRERSTLLIIIAALAREAKIKIDLPGKAAIFIEGLTDSMGISDANKLPWHRSMAFADAIKGGVGWLEVGIRQKAKSHITADMECHQRLGGLLRYCHRKAA